jgi:hypothetical protein
MTRSHTIARHAAALLLAGAVVTPAASARVDLRSPDARDAAVGRYVTGTPGPAGHGYRYLGSTLVPIGSAPHASGVRVVRVADRGGFDWGDAGIGGAGGIALALVAFSVSGAVRERGGARRRLHTASGTGRS